MSMQMGIEATRASTHRKAQPVKKIVTTALLTVALVAGSASAAFAGSAWKTPPTKVEAGNTWTTATLGNSWSGSTI
jgi:hypothetical protein